MGGGASRWRRAAQKIGFPCAFLVRDAPPHQNSTTILNSTDPKSSVMSERTDGEEHNGFPAKQSLCTICLEPLLLNEGGSSCRQSKIFTAQCSHTFHLPCIASNIRHGNTTCPICRTHWLNLPRHLLIASRPSRPLDSASADPILRILDDSIATSRVNRRFSLRSTRYDDDDPTEPNSASPTRNTRLLLSFVRHSTHPPHHLLLRLAPQLPLDLVLVVTPKDAHLRRLKQAIALVVFSLRPTDRLALVTCSPIAATRAFALHRMSSHGKRAALQVIDRLSYIGEADPTEGLQKAARILEDRTHQNPNSSIMHLSDSPTEGAIEQRAHWFNIGFHLGDSSGFIMHEFEEFLARVIGEEVMDVRLTIGKEGRVVGIGDLRCGEERRIMVDLSGEMEFVHVRYEYKECGSKEVVVRGEMVVELGEKGDGGNVEGEEDEEEEMSSGFGPRRSCAERWDYLDPFMARRWAKHLHGFRV
ncbi:uncharacterized protein LOC110024373 [Phalaenopsis equestris]|uniref:uncharacterized protein LOC110024373 n=1 Tax=Phalaenopsis equestris TaxID=78828 RepID=UPI0009E4CC17|nr:uncharacterized protein LOC110024373 [Phalaenopsis equestris]